MRRQRSAEGVPRVKMVQTGEGVAGGVRGQRGLERAMMRWCIAGGGEDFFLVYVDAKAHRVGGRVRKGAACWIKYFPMRRVVVI